VKPAIAAAALAEGIITPNTTVQSSGGIRVGTTFFPDWKAGGHGLTNVRKAIALSVNTFFYTVGGGYGNFIGLGVDRLTMWLRNFGLGKKTGLDIPGESSGFVPSKEWKERTKGERWYVGDTYNLSIGQGDLLVTPLQVALWTAEIANGGFSIVPHVVGRIGNDDKVFIATSTHSPVAIVNSSIIQVVQQGMRDNVMYGSGRSLSTLSFSASGKTGTAQWRNDKPNHAWFTSYAPSESPEIVVTVLLEEGIEGSLTAVPIAKKILQAWNDQRVAAHSPAKAPVAQEL
jgi:penicillin-binding protein 2